MPDLAQLGELAHPSNRDAEKLRDLLTGAELGQKRGVGISGHGCSPLLLN